ncbi:MAG: hypothetical protein IJI35_15265 [Kiritimatiellae bacterium]|nr:hypothetical protein [Kiritimatiellia bacterium]
MREVTKNGFMGGIAAVALAAFSPCTLIADANSFASAKLHVQVDVENIDAKSMPLYLADARAAGADAVQIAVCDFFCRGEARRHRLETVKYALAEAEKAGFATAVWTSSIGYGSKAAPETMERFAGSTRLTALDGKAHRSAAICPLDPTLREALCENVRDYIRAGAKFILWDDDFIQSARWFVCCTCPRHLALVREKLGRDVTASEIRDSFCGGPNAVRTAFLDADRDAAKGLARLLRETADATAPNIGMGLCATYTLYDIEGTDVRDIVAAFAGNGPKVFRLSGATYWPLAGSERYPGQGLDGVFEYMRLQRTLLAGSGITLLDENDPHPRRTSVVPAWATELFDKVVIAAGGIVRNKYILRYPADRSEQGYLFAHLENKRDDAKLSAMFAGTEDCGWRVVFPEHLAREAELPGKYVGDRELMNVFSFPLASHFLALNGHPSKFSGKGPSIAFGPAAVMLDDAAMRRGVLLDRYAAGILEKRGIRTGPSGIPGNSGFATHADAQGRKFAVFGFDAMSLDFAGYAAGSHRTALAEAMGFFGAEVPCRVESDSHVYQMVKRDPRTGEMSVLVENLTDAPADVKVLVGGKATVVSALRGEFRAVPGGFALERLAPHEFAAVRIRLQPKEAIAKPLRDASFGRAVSTKPPQTAASSMPPYQVLQLPHKTN